jgi:hypothetical protein
MKLAVAAAAAFLAGCANMADVPPADSEARVPLTCASKPQCDAYWARAQAWIASHSAYKIQTATDAVIQTHGPIEWKPQLAYTVTREPKADGSARILINAGCYSPIGCTPSREQATIEFKRYVRDADKP